MDANPNGFVPEARIAMERVNLVSEELKTLTSRVERVESKTEDIHKLAINMERLTVTLQQVVENLHEHETRLDKIESEPAGKWHEAMKYIGTAILGAIVAMVLKQIGLM